MKQPGAGRDPGPRSEVLRSSDHNLPNRVIALKGPPSAPVEGTDCTVRAKCKAAVGGGCSPVTLKSTAKRTRQLARAQETRTVVAGAMRGARAASSL